MNIVSKFLTPEILEDLPNISGVVKFTDGFYGDLNYIGFCIIEDYESQEIRYFCGGESNFLEIEDLDLIRAWKPNIKDSFYENYFRFDFKRFIYIFENIAAEHGRVLMGNLLKKNNAVRLDLITLQQDYLMRLLLHGRKRRIS